MMHGNIEMKKHSSKYRNCGMSGNADQIQTILFEDNEWGADFELN